MRLVSHTAIVKLVHIFDSDESVDLVLEHMGGGDLVQYMKINPALSEEQAGRVIHKVLEALSYLHDQKIIHRDIKLENIMLR
jgi:serine/threonine protein kinase